MPNKPRTHGQQHGPRPAKKRQSAAKRGYGRSWQKASKAFLMAHPLCAECDRQGTTGAATLVDHVIPHKGNQVLFWDESNWQSLCKRCHDRKTRIEDQHPEYAY